MPDGYGHVNYKGTHVTASRLVLFLLKKCSLTGGKLVVMHSCDNPPCVNPDHLSVGSYSRNIKDGRVSKIRRHFGKNSST